MVSELVDLVQKTCGNLSMIKFCEHLMTLGFKYSTKSGISISIIDLIKPMGKKILLKNMRTMVTKL